MVDQPGEGKRGRKLVIAWGRSRSFSADAPFHYFLLIIPPVRRGGGGKGVRKRISWGGREKGDRVEGLGKMSCLYPYFSYRSFAWEGKRKKGQETS